MDIKYSTENNGETYMKITIGKNAWTITGYSRAAIKTCIMINELNLAFDMGYASDHGFALDNKLISHGHCDHIGALHTDHCTRAMFNINKDKLYIMPFQCIKPFKLVVSGISEMNNGRLSTNIKILDNLVQTNIVESESCLNDYYPLLSKGQKSEYVVKSFLMDHKVTSFGYIIYRKSEKLKPEYTNLDRDAIIALKKHMTKLTDTFYTPLLAYTGDTTIEPIIKNPELLNVPLLIMECTGFSDDDTDSVQCGKHIHFKDIINNQELFKNEKILLFHFSQKYKTLDDILELTNNFDITSEFKNKLLYFY